MGHAISQFFWWFTGGRDEGGRAYGLWSGFGGAVPDFLILGGLVQVYRTHSCAHKPCRRWAHHVTKNGYKLCKKHIGVPEDDLILHPIDPSHT